MLWFVEGVRVSEAKLKYAVYCAIAQTKRKDSPVTVVKEDSSIRFCVEKENNQYVFDIGEFKPIYKYERFCQLVFSSNGDLIKRADFSKQKVSKTFTDKILQIMKEY
jgi:hypothetical protein